MKSTVWKRATTLFLIVALLISIYPVKVYAAEDELTEGCLSVQTMKFSDDGGYVEDGKTEIIDILVQNQCILVNIKWLCDKLSLVCDIKDGDQGFLWQMENAGDVDIYGLNVKVKDLQGIQKRIKGYKAAFNGISGGKELRIRKTSDSSLVFFLRTGSDQAYAYSAYTGELNAALGTKVLEKNGEIYVPLTMFLNLVDSYCCLDESTVVLYPCQNTVVDIVHNSKNLHQKYNFDIAEDGSVGELGYNIASGYDNFYRKIKSLFQGAVSLDGEKIMQAWPTDTTNESNALAVQLCTNSQDDLDALSENVLLSADTIAMDGLLNSFIEDTVTDLAKVEVDKVVEKWVETEGKLAKTSGSVSVDEYMSMQSKAAREIMEQKQIKESVVTKSGLLNDVGTGASIAFSGFVKYCTLASEISAAPRTYVDSVLQYIESYRKLNIAAMDTKMIDEIAEKANLYSSRDINPFENSALMDEIVQEVRNATRSALAGEVTSGMMSKFALKTLWQLQIISIGWDAAEAVIDKATGGTFTGLDALHYGTYTMLLEQDSNCIVSDYINHELSLDVYRQLEWVRLRSYYMARQDLITFYQPQKKRMPDVYNVAMKDILEECDELQKMMAVLSTGLTGVTQESLDICVESNVDDNASLLKAVKVVNKELLEKLISGYWWNSIQAINAYKFEKDGTFYQVWCTYSDETSVEPLVIKDERMDYGWYGTYEIIGDEVILHREDYDSTIRLRFVTADDGDQYISAAQGAFERDEWDSIVSYVKACFYSGKFLYETDYVEEHNGGSSNAVWMCPYGELEKAFDSKFQNMSWKEAYQWVLDDWRRIEKYTPDGNTYVSTYFGDDYQYDEYFVYDLNKNGVPELFLYSTTMGITEIFTFENKIIWLGENQFYGINKTTKEMIVHGHWHGAGGSYFNEWSSYTIQDNELILNMYIDNLGETADSGGIIVSDGNDYETNKTKSDYDKAYKAHVAPSVSFDNFKRYVLSDKSGLSNY